MQTLEKALTQLVADGVVDLEQARLVSLYLKEVEAAPSVPAPLSRTVSSGAGSSRQAV